MQCRVNAKGKKETCSTPCDVLLLMVNGWMDVTGSGATTVRRISLPTWCNCIAEQSRHGSYVCVRFTYKYNVNCGPEKLARTRKARLPRPVGRTGLHSRFLCNPAGCGLLSRCVCSSGVGFGWAWSECEVRLGPSPDMSSR
jgi:hypothetical protein